MRSVRPVRRAALVVLGLLAFATAGCGTRARVGVDPAAPPLPAVSATRSASPAASVAAVTASPSATPASTAAPAATPARVVPLPAITVRPQPFARDAALEATLREVLGPDRDSYSVFVKRLSDGAGASVNQDTPYAAASIFKLYVMWEAVRQISFGTLDPAQTMEVTAYYAGYELGTHEVQVGDYVTVHEALRLMMSISDTPTAVLLQDTVGWEHVNASLRAIDIEDSGLFYPETGPIATARDIGVLLEAIAAGRTLSPAAHTTMRDLLLSETTDNGLRAGVPETVAVAHKTGLSGSARHDADIVYLASAPYVIVVLSDRESGTNLTASIARAVYAYYAART